MALVVVDVSAVLHTGAGLTSSTARYNGVDISGLRYLVNKVVGHLTNNDRIFLCFDRKHSKKFGSKYPYKTELEGYKSNRKVDMSIVLQNELAFEFFTRAGIPCLRHENRELEADDLIYNVVEWNRVRMKSGEINVLTADYDLAHNVGYSNGISIQLLPANSNINKINYLNFRTAIYPGVELMLNTISAYKVFHGDNSDNIKAMPSASRYYKEYVAFLKQLQEATNNYSSYAIRQRNYLELFLKHLQKEEGWGDEMMNTYNARISRIFPKLIGEVDKSYDVDKVDYSGVLLTRVERQSLVDLIYLSDAAHRPTYLSKELRNGYTKTSLELWNNYINDYASGKFQASLVRPTRTQDSSKRSFVFEGRGVIE